MSKDTGWREIQQGPGMHLEKDIQGTVEWRSGVKGLPASALSS